MTSYLSRLRNLTILIITLAVILTGQIAKATVNDRIEFRGRIMIDATTPATGSYTMRISFWTGADLNPGVDIDGCVFK